jgi:hypothetical protein
MHVAHLRGLSLTHTWHRLEVLNYSGLLAGLPQGRSDLWASPLPSGGPHRTRLAFLTFAPSSMRPEIFTASLPTDPDDLARVMYLQNTFRHTPGRHHSTRGCRHRPDEPQHRAHLLSIAWTASNADLTTSPTDLDCSRQTHCHATYPGSYEWYELRVHA